MDRWSRSCHIGIGVGSVRVHGGRRFGCRRSCHSNIGW